MDREDREKRKDGKDRENKENRDDRGKSGKREKIEGKRAAHNESPFALVHSIITTRSTSPPGTFKLISLNKRKFKSDTLPDKKDYKKRKTELKEGSGGTKPLETSELILYITSFVEIQTQAALAQCCTLFRTLLTLNIKSETPSRGFILLNNIHLSRKFIMTKIAQTKTTRIKSIKWTVKSDVTIGHDDDYDHDHSVTQNPFENEIFFPSTLERLIIQSTHNHTRFHSLIKSIWDCNELKILCTDTIFDGWYTNFPYHVFQLKINFPKLHTMIIHTSFTMTYLEESKSLDISLQPIVSLLKHTPNIVNLRFECYSTHISFGSLCLEKLEFLQLIGVDETQHIDLTGLPNLKCLMYHQSSNAHWERQQFHLFTLAQKSKLTKLCLINSRCMPNYTCWKSLPLLLHFELTTPNTSSEEFEFEFPDACRLQMHCPLLETFICRFRHYTPVRRGREIEISRDTGTSNETLEKKETKHKYKYELQSQIKNYLDNELKEKLKEKENRRLQIEKKKVKFYQDILEWLKVLIRVDKCLVHLKRFVVTVDNDQTASGDSGPNRFVYHTNSTCYCKTFFQQPENVSFIIDSRVARPNLHVYIHTCQFFYDSHHYETSPFLLRRKALLSWGDQFKYAYSNYHAIFHRYNYENDSMISPFWYNGSLMADETDKCYLENQDDFTKSMPEIIYKSVASNLFYDRPCL